MGCVGLNPKYPHRFRRTVLFCLVYRYHRLRSAYKCLDAFGEVENRRTTGLSGPARLTSLQDYTAMADPPERKMVQTVLNLHPERRKNAATGNRSPYFSKPPQNTSATPLGVGAGGQEMEDAQPTSISNSQGREAAYSQCSNLRSQRGSVAREERRQILSQVAKETTCLLPGILATAPHAPPKGYLYSPPSLPVLKHKYCPGFPATAIRILDEDTLDAAIGLAQCGKYITVHDRQPVCVLNMANAYNAGGGWKMGALAQEEAICYRSSLSFTLKLRYYPLPEFGAIY